MTQLQSENLLFEPLTAAHVQELFPILTTPTVLAFIDQSSDPVTIEDFKVEYASRARGPTNPTTPDEQWFNMLVRLQAPPFPAIGRLEATSYGEWGELAYLFGEAWWGKGLAFEAMLWWHNFLAVAVPRTQWWATVHPKNLRSICLLKRLKYEEIELSMCPKLYSYESGDLCFVQSKI